MKRKRLCLLFYIRTDKSEYMVYNTQAIHDDALTVEIEKNKSQIILEDKLIDEALGTMGGDSFYSFICTTLRMLLEYIKSNDEIVVQAVDCKHSNKFNQFFKKRNGRSDNI